MSRNNTNNKAKNIFFFSPEDRHEIDAFYKVKLFINYWRALPVAFGGRRAREPCIGPRRLYIRVLGQSTVRGRPDSTKRQRSVRLRGGFDWRSGRRAMAKFKGRTDRNAGADRFIRETDQVSFPSAGGASAVRRQKSVVRSEEQETVGTEERFLRIL